MIRNSKSQNLRKFSVKHDRGIESEFRNACLGTISGVESFSQRRKVSQSNSLRCFASLRENINLGQDYRLGVGSLQCVRDWSGILLELFRTTDNRQRTTDNGSF